ncbi:GNAT family N-acetyltransferase [Bosea sp. (in: a-proteobacteria)]|uniref:GNAT family N-acetyltransferase n=1 Tax=Bosea sp. (in: a-proteobacteria) TaxID=1871050 RepID=UPI002634FC68|nr:GNAT family N-acetyltransferase [Bosea sp. (in: a-proteobacteria)]MCO5090092.1 N-acetyltransferase [Bosea sp. (in: a-proteobacteria)]
MDVVDNAGGNRFELPLDGGTAFVDYRRDGGRLVLDHTEVPAQFAGQGVGSRLAKGVFEQLRASGRKAEIRCEFLQGWIAKHPEYGDVVEG